MLDKQHAVSNDFRARLTWYIRGKKNQESVVFSEHFDSFEEHSSYFEKSTIGLIMCVDDNFQVEDGVLTIFIKVKKLLTALNCKIIKQLKNLISVGTF